MKSLFSRFKRTAQQGIAALGLAGALAGPVSATEPVPEVRPPVRFTHEFIDDVVGENPQLHEFESGFTYRWNIWAEVDSPDPLVAIDLTTRIDSKFTFVLSLPPTPHLGTNDLFYKKKMDPQNNGGYDVLDDPHHRGFIRSVVYTYDPADTINPPQGIRKGKGIVASFRVLAPAFTEKRQSARFSIDSAYVYRDNNMTLDWHQRSEDIALPRYSGVEYFLVPRLTDAALPSNDGAERVEVLVSSRGLPCVLDKLAGSFQLAGNNAWSPVWTNISGISKAYADPQPWNREDPVYYRVRPYQGSILNAPQRSSESLRR